MGPISSHIFPVFWDLLGQICINICLSVDLFRPLPTKNLYPSVFSYRIRKKKAGKARDTVGEQKGLLQMLLHLLREVWPDTMRKHVVSESNVIFVKKQEVPVEI